MSAASTPAEPVKEAAKSPERLNEKSTSPSSPSSSSTSGSPHGKSNSCSVKALLTLYKLVSVFRKYLRRITGIMAARMDNSLSSIGYSTLLTSALLKKISQTGQIGSLATHLRSGYAMISDFRMFYRMWGTLSVLEWTIDTLENPGSSDPLIRGCTYIQAVAGTFYQVLESIAYLSSKKVFNIAPAVEGKIWIYSCVFWALHVQLELIKLLQRKLHGEKDLFKPFFINLAWLPLTVHWSLEKGFLTDTTVGLFGACASIPNIAPAWVAAIKGSS